MLYYCGGKNCNPEWERWLNDADVSYLAPESVNGLNLVAYCGSNTDKYKQGPTLGNTKVVSSSGRLAVY